MINAKTAVTKAAEGIMTEAQAKIDAGGLSIDDMINLTGIIKTNVQMLQSVSKIPDVVPPVIPPV